jgi:hypothetical protein
MTTLSDIEAIITILKWGIKGNTKVRLRIFDSSHSFSIIKLTIQDDIVRMNWSRRNRRYLDIFSRDFILVGYNDIVFDSKVITTLIGKKNVRLIGSSEELSQIGHIPRKKSLYSPGIVTVDSLDIVLGNRPNTVEIFSRERRTHWSIEVGHYISNFDYSPSVVLVSSKEG